MRQRAFHSGLQAGLLALTLLGAPVAAAQTDTGDEAETAGELPIQSLRQFVDAFEQIRNHYVEEVDDRTLLNLAVEGMLQGLDPHSAYLDARDFRNLQDDTVGEFGGLGLEVGLENGFIHVIAPIDDTPAKAAGIESGDIIIRINEKPAQGLSLDEAVNLMRGEPGTSLELTLLREGIEKPLTVTLTRAIIQIRSVRHRMLSPGFGYIRIAQFQKDTGKEVADAIRQLQADAAPLKGLVLDLRNNPGGILQASVAVADHFLDEGLVVYTEGRMPNSELRYKATPGDVTAGLPLVVLINGGSASASEIVAGALQDHQRAVLMGTTSFGKGSVQSILMLSEEEAIKLTTALYFTPHGRSIQAQGIEPDITVTRARVTPLEASSPAVKEADLNRHLRNGNGKPDKRTHPESAENSLQTEDNQLYEALNLLKGLALLAHHSSGRDIAGTKETTATGDTDAPEEVPAP